MTEHQQFETDTMALANALHELAREQHARNVYDLNVYGEQSAMTVEDVTRLGDAMWPAMFATMHLDQPKTCPYIWWDQDASKSRDCEKPAGHPGACGPTA